MRYMLARLRRGEQGFTLIELLVVVAIIALLATFAAPKLFDAINKSKQAPGQADLQTISSALDRYYMDQNRFPASGDATSGLTGAYLKSSTSFANGYGKRYVYGTTVDGDGYVLIDMKKDDPPASITCGLQAYAVTATGSGFHTIANIAAAHINSCALPGSSIVTH